MTLANLADRLAGALAADPVPPDLLLGDNDELASQADDAMAPAAVLVAVTDRARPGVILTQRTDTLRRHAGQVAFPGGRLDPGEDAVTAALREAEEEIALPRGVPVVVGTGDRYLTGTGYAVTPVLAAIPADIAFVRNVDEVASVFEVPLGHLLDPANHVAARMEWRGAQRQFYEIHWHDRRIWGATAAMIVNLSRRLRWT